MLDIYFDIELANMDVVAYKINGNHPALRY